MLLWVLLFLMLKYFFERCLHCYSTYVVFNYFEIGSVCTFPCHSISNNIKIGDLYVR